MLCYDRCNWNGWWLCRSGQVSIDGSRHLFSNMALALPKTVASEGVEMLQLCLAYDPAKRLTVGYML